MNLACCRDAVKRQRTPERSAFASPNHPVELTAHGAGFFPGLTLAQTLQPVRERVAFLGFKDWPELPACYAEADILCVPSRYDGWGLVVPEGLVSGLRQSERGSASGGAAIRPFLAGLSINGTDVFGRETLSAALCYTGSARRRR